MNYFAFWATLFILAALIIYFDRKYNMLRDTSTATPRPYSFARVQLAWWTVIVLSSIIAIIFCRDWQIPDLTTSTLYLLGISSATTVSATLIDVSDQSNPNISTLNQNSPGENFFLDMLSDKDGVSVHRFQTVVFNLVFGAWFIRNFLTNLADTTTEINNIMPDFTDNNLILLGVSSGLYAALKATENRQGGSAQTATTAAPTTAPANTTEPSTEDTPVG